MQLNTIKNPTIIGIEKNNLFYLESTCDGRIDIHLYNKLSMHVNEKLDNIRWQIENEIIRSHNTNNK